MYIYIYTAPFFCVHPVYKVNLPLCLVEGHATKAYGAVEIQVSSVLI